MVFCHEFNRVSQPPSQLQDGGIYSHAGCVGLSLASVPDAAIRRQCQRPQRHQGVEVYEARARPVTGMGGMNQLFLGAVAVLTARGRGRAQHRSAVQQSSGSGRHDSGSGGPRTLRSAQRARGFASTILSNDLGEGL